MFAQLNSDIHHQGHNQYPGCVDTSTENERYPYRRALETKGAEAAVAGMRATRPSPRHRNSVSATESPASPVTGHWGFWAGN